MEPFSIVPAWLRRQLAILTPKKTLVRAHLKRLTADRVDFMFFLLTTVARP
jgi:hypothetical protein